MNIKENISYLHYFGLKLTFWKSVYKIIRKKKGILTWNVKNINTKTIENYIKIVCHDTYNDFCKNNIMLEDLDVVANNLKLYPELKNNVIWTMWWQGEKNAPEIVKHCINSMRKNANGHQVIVLDKINYSKYVQLPEDIIIRHERWKKDNTNLRNCSVDNTKLSDIIRCALLAYYGGVWCDATVFFSDTIPETFFSEEWTTLGQDDNWYIGKGKWSTFFMGAQCNSLLFMYLYKMHIEYFTKKQYWVHYLLIDYFIDIAYQENVHIKDMIDNVKSENKKCLTFNRLYNKKANINEINNFMKRQRFHKLSWRWWGSTNDASVKINTDNNELTWFGYLYENYMKNS